SRCKEERRGDTRRRGVMTPQIGCCRRNPSERLPVRRTDLRQPPSGIVLSESSLALQPSHVRLLRFGGAFTAMRNPAVPVGCCISNPDFFVMGSFNETNRIRHR
ncbi:MAG: hypothetical protein KDA81_13505, partial [Planctomycetaceae bacterium]|nr:hypothetical protein [Planctomycetaceae bacterium]